jgi:hypothetical protein
MADLSSLPKIYLRRTGVVFTTTITEDGETKTVQGRCGELTAGPVKYSTIERYKYLNSATNGWENYVSLPTGEFILTLDFHNRMGRKVFFIQPDGKYGHNKLRGRDGQIAEILIHSANTVADINGCLAPGKSFDATKNNLLQSTQAMNELFAFFNNEKLAGWIVVEN